MAAQLRAFACCMTVTAIMPARTLDLVVPLGHEPTELRASDTAADGGGTSRAAAPLSSLRPGALHSTNDSPTPATTPTPGARTSTTATRTTTTRTTRTGLAPSADRAASGAGFSFEDLVLAYFDCRRTKRNSASALAFEAALEPNLRALHDELAAGTYRPGPSICFVITRPKPREVWAASFRDRIVHHLLYRAIGARFERAFIADSCACIPGRGTLYAAERLERKVRSITANWSRPAWYLKCDLANFFVSIHKPTLAAQLEERIQESAWRALALQILFHDPRPGAVVQSPPALLARIPAHKSLFNQDADHGLPIGNLSSQFFANVHLNALDQFVKRRLHVRHYVRYVDDFVLLHESPPQLNAWLAEISAFLPARLRLELNPAKTILQPVARGIDFVGHLFLPHRRQIRRRTIRAAEQRLRTMPSADLWQSANSYLGLLRQAPGNRADRARIANIARRRGLSVDHRLTMAYP